jgi:predicted metal-dependent phosphoesterase TrpH
VTSPLLRIDLHAHTRVSHDGWTTPAQFARRAAQVGLDRIAVTDHGTLKGALAAAAVDPERIIIGEEMRCREGLDLIGLFLRETIPDGLPARETADAIRTQGGVVYAPHPFAYLRHVRERVALAFEFADVIEAFNSRAFAPTWNRRATAAAREAGRPAFASSDAHFPWEIGRAWTELPPFHDAKSFLAAARQATPRGARTGTPFLFAASLAVSVVKTGRPHF